MNLALRLTHACASPQNQSELSLRRARCCRRTVRAGSQSSRAAEALRVSGSTKSVLQTWAEPGEARQATNAGTTTTSVPLRAGSTAVTTHSS